MSEQEWRSDKITAAHLSQCAYIYIRQSTMGQVTKHKESTELQYGLAQRAERLGWPREAVKIIDEDLGQSGRISAERRGFQQLITEIGLGRVGIVLSYDASRLARNNKDWYHLLELCTLFDTLIGDSERIYNPSLYHDRLLLGLSGLMSEAELHHLRRRLLAGKQAKAERGELRQRLPVGLVRMPGGEVIQHPHEEVRSRIDLVFAKFQELGSANAVARYCQRANLSLPVRPVDDHDSTDHQWREATRQLILYILHNPAYAGAFAYGQKKNAPNQPPNAAQPTPRQWEILLHDRYPAYISWPTYLANQEQLSLNLANYSGARPGVARAGDCLLQGILICHQCGLHMLSRYGGPGQYPLYLCSRPRLDTDAQPCQRVWGKALDAEIEQVILAALAPDQIAIALAAHEKAEQEDLLLHRQWTLRLERLHYECERAGRQYDRVEPENRLVARALERVWEEKLLELEQAERDHTAWQQQQAQSALPLDQTELMTLADSLPTFWYSPTTTAKDKKEIIRLLISHVIVEQDREQGKTWFQVNWQTGAISQHAYLRPVGTYAQAADQERLQQRMRQLAAEHHSAREMAQLLNEEGFRTARRKPFTPAIVNNLRAKWEIGSWIKEFHPPPRWPDGSYSVAGAAHLLGLSQEAIRKRIASGSLTAYQSRKGAPWHLLLGEPALLDEAAGPQA